MFLGNIIIEDSTEGSSSSDESKHSDGPVPLSMEVEVNTLPVLASTATTPDLPTEEETVAPYSGTYNLENNFTESTSEMDETDQYYEKSTNTEAISEDEIHECYDFAKIVSRALCKIKKDRRDHCMHAIVHILYDYSKDSNTN